MRSTRPTAHLAEGTALTAGEADVLNLDNVRWEVPPEVRSSPERAGDRCATDDGAAYVVQAAPTGGGSVRSPTALPPFGEVRSLRSEGGVVAMTWVDPGLVG